MENNLASLLVPFGKTLGEIPLSLVVNRQATATRARYSALIAFSIRG